MARYVCSNPERRAAVEASPLSGIDYLEILDGGKTATHPEWDPLRQLFLAVRLLKPVPATMGAAAVRVDGGVRVTPVRALWAMPLGAVAGAAGVPAAEKAFVADRLAGAIATDHLLVVRTDSAGDFSTYRLRLVDPGDPVHLPPPVGFDPRLSAVDFSFKVECPSDFDCKPATACSPPAYDEPEINYLAKDYASFRRLMLDRLSAIAPSWRERSPADLGVAVVELLAYAGDQLSYFQDAAATEAYLGTARKRISVRRHARLVDYFLHEGANARAWVVFELGAGSPADGLSLPAHIPVLTRAAAGGTVISPPDLAAAEDAGGAVVFETLDGVTLHSAHDAIAFYTWSDRQCCLPAGATAATLAGPLPDLQPNQLLLLEEVKGPQTGAVADADPRHRQVVRLITVAADVDKLTGQPVAEVTWSVADALTFPLCVSAITDADHGAHAIDGVSVARGNVAPADHGFTVAGEKLGAAPPAGGDPFRPVLQRGPLTHAVPLPAGFATAPAVSLAGALPALPVLPGLPALPALPADTAPVVSLVSLGESWTPQRDLLAAGRFDRSFVAEMDEAGLAHLRFGDDTNGRAPSPGAALAATYRVGNGKAGNVGAEALGQVVIDESLLPLDMTLPPAQREPDRSIRAAKLRAGIRAVRNPLPARGGVEAESLEEARQYAPQAFRFQERAVTEDDYATVAGRHPEVQRAAATFRFTGSWTTVFLTVDRQGGSAVDAAFKARLKTFMDRFRMAGYDLEVDGPRPVALDLALAVCAGADYFRGEVLAALLERFGTGLLADGRRAFFHPDEWTFGQPVYLSRIYAAASAVPGVESVSVERFQRLGRPAQGEIAAGVLPVGRLEIALLANDPSFQENGKLQISLGGGK